MKIRLMAKGKMHGQAFVTLPDREAAVRALTDVLGFLLHDRPMILVRFDDIPVFSLAWMGIAACVARFKSNIR